MENEGGEMKKLRYRQIHLDFHTGPAIPDVGKNFEPEEFVKTMKSAYVNSVTAFAKGHHGLSYYPTKIGKMHPSLKKDLLGNIIKVCHREGINVVAYISVKLDEYIASKHPEYLQISPEGCLYTSPLQAGWKAICLNSEYVEYLHKQTEEVLKKYPVDGVFFDIVNQLPCICKNCLEGMKKEKLNPEDENDLKKYVEIVEKKFLRETYNLVKKLRPEISIFFNSRLKIGMEDEFKYYTHFEIESLPSGGWGYNHFPMMVKYFQTQKKEFLGMTGRFHRGWADFGGIKKDIALEYEIFTMLANGSKCSIGDQMHPRGTLDKQAYDLIGKIYKKVERVEKYYDKVKPYAEIGIFTEKKPEGKVKESLEGAFRVLFETHNQFQIITEENNFEKYKLIIFPDFMRINERVEKKLKNYLKNGGKALFSFDSGLKKEKDEFIFDNIKFERKSPYKPDYFRFDKKYNKYGTVFVMYEPGNYVKVKKGKVIAEVWKPYFNRTWQHFSSHFQTPYDKPAGYPAVIIEKNISYIWAPVFLNYITYGNNIYREMVEIALGKMTEKNIEVENIPPNAYVYYQEGKNSFLVSILYYPYQRLSKTIDVISSKGILKDVKIKIKDKKAKRIIDIETEKNIEFTNLKDGVKIKIDFINGFTGIYGEVNK